MSAKKTLKIFSTFGCYYCPTCTLMVEQINREWGNRFNIKEIKTNTAEGEQEAKRLGIYSLPAIYVNDKEAHRGSCGNKDKLKAEIERASAQAHRP